MKRIVIVLVLVIAAGAQTITLHPAQQYGTLQRAEKMTPDELKQLADARDKIARAEADLATVQAQIAGNHKMGKESYMEWSRWYSFDGDYVLQYGQSYMNGITLDGAK